MDTLSALESFVSAVQLGSLSGAARQRRVSQPAISQQISALETLYDTQFLLRNRSGVRMTQSGELLYKHAVNILDEQENLKSGLDNLTGKVAGDLVVTANLGLSQHVMGEVIIALAKQHPDLRISLRADDRILDLSTENIDIALRSGTVGNGNGVARKIAALSVLLVATPEYLDFAGRPSCPEDLINLDHIQYKVSYDQIATPLIRAGQIIQAPIKIGLTAQFPDFIIQALMGNLGYAKLPEFLAADAVANGQLEVVLPDWKTPEKELFIVYPTREKLSPRFLVFLNALFQRLEMTSGVTMLTSAGHLV